MDWILGKLKSALITLLGVAAMLGWWTLTGNDDESAVHEVEAIPTVVGEGGRLIDVDLNANQPFYFSVTFECGDSESNSVYAREELEPGTHHYSIDVEGSCTYASIESGIPEAPLGSELGWRVSVDGKSWEDERLTLDKPLEPGWAFGLVSGWDDGTLDEMIAYRAER